MHRMNRRMVDTAVETLREVDVVVLVVDVSQRQGRGDAFVLDLVKQSASTAILVLNKIDLIRKSALLPVIAQYAETGLFRAIVPVSAATGDGLERLEAEILEALPEGEPLYPEDYLTDQTQRMLAAELIREKVLHHTHDELPYTTGVVVERYEEPEEPGGLTKIYASILVETESQKPIVVGKGGAMIRQIGTEARRELEGMLGGRVFLDLHVKVRTDWRDDVRILDEMGLRGRK
jgi:GTP-binding protein Era